MNKIKAWIKAWQLRQMTAAGQILVKALDQCDSTLPCDLWNDFMEWRDICPRSDRRCLKQAEIRYRRRSVEAAILKNTVNGWGPERLDVENKYPKPRIVIHPQQMDVNQCDAVATSVLGTL